MEVLLSSSIWHSIAALFSCIFFGQVHSFKNREEIAGYSHRYIHVQLFVPTTKLLLQSTKFDITNQSYFKRNL